MSNESEDSNKRMARPNSNDEYQRKGKAARTDAAVHASEDNTAFYAFGTPPPGPFAVGTSRAGGSLAQRVDYTTYPSHGVVVNAIVGMIAGIMNGPIEPYFDWPEMPPASPFHALKKMSLPRAIREAGRIGFCQSRQAKDAKRRQEAMNGTKPRVGPKKVGALWSK